MLRMTNFQNSQPYSSDSVYFGFVCICSLFLSEHNLVCVCVCETLAIQWQAFPSGEIDEVQWPRGQGRSSPLLGLLSGPLSTPQPHRIHHSICCWHTHSHTHTRTLRDSELDNIRAR